MIQKSPPLKGEGSPSADGEQGDDPQICDLLKYSSLSFELTIFHPPLPSRTLSGGTLINKILSRPVRDAPWETDIK